MRKIFQRNPNPSDNLESDEYENKNVKTTDVNILLNRVRLDQKKTFKKKLLVSLLAVGLICSITIFLII